jgi:hypothetical protein
MTTQEQMAATTDPAIRKWQIAVGVLALLCTVLLLINVVLRVRADQAIAERDTSVAQAEQAKADAGTLQRRNDELLSQLSTSNERLSEIINILDLSDEQLSAADADVAKQVAAQQRAEKALSSANSAGTRADAYRTQLRNAQTCAAAAILAIQQIHAGPDIESGASEAADTLDRVSQACQAGLK